MIKTQLEERNITYKNVLGSISKVERHLYVPEKYTEFVYNNYPLRIGYGQTIFQPYLVAYMILILNLEKTDKVLEIGTGSVYQTAILV